MAHKIRINTNRLNNDANDIYNRIQAMKKEMDTMKGDVQAMNSMWEGESKNAFVEAFDTDMTALATMINNIEAIYRFETNAKTKYENCEDKVAQLIADIKV